ncbi:hypothetical protein [Methylobacterium platani]|jgi:hypothetical protein|uniref:Uncharacterized protein n=2 Tax=Methylobacterium platani TaxID=427683 RepID=A0A179S8B8_9HYPH|nr:hypothetical protein [Methylobacterium platani]KMO10606.1 hypothetical protein SQ03_29775 [Methylobacterium platani JCM 14648]OAS23955.1 hypothetical protein A5481_16035 [Methylobacterium platani]
MRTCALAFAALAVAVAVPAEAARRAKPQSEPAPFPQAGDRWHLSVRSPAEAGRERFARVYADPVEGTERWAMKVTCGTASKANGRERIELQATGEGGRDRSGNLGWTWTPVGGGETGGAAFLFERGLEPEVHMAPPCPSGRGDLSSGD